MSQSLARTFAVLSLLFVPMVVLTGCAMQTTAGPVLDVPSGGLKGVVHGGQQPVNGATVTVYAVGSSGYGTGATAMASATTDSGGGFSFASSAYVCPAANTPMYIVATGGIPSGSTANPNLAMIAALGNCSVAKNETVLINEVTTAATVISLGQFLGTTLGTGVTPNIGGTCGGCATGVYNQGLVNAMNNTYPQLVDNSKGAAVASSVSGSVTITTEASKINTIANVLAACINTTGETSTTETTTVCGKLFSGVNETGAGTRPYDTIQAALQMVLYPWWNVSTVYNLGTSTPPFVGVSSTPNDWTVAISYAYPNMSVGVSGSSTHITSMNLDIDKSGRIWFPSTQSGAVGVGYFDPATTSFNGPYNSSTSPLVHPQFLAIDTVGYVWATDISGTNIEGFNTTLPTSAPTVLSIGHSPIGAIGAAGTELYSTSLNPNIRQIRISSTGASAVIDGTLTGGYIGLPLGTGVVSTGVGFEGTLPDFSSSGGSTGGTQCYVSSPYNAPNSTRNSTNTNCNSGGAATYHISGTNFGGTSAAVIAVSYDGQFDNNLLSAFYIPALTMSGAEGVAVDGNNQVWVANSGNSSITTYGFPYNASSTAQVTQTATVPYLHDATHGNTLTDPFALGIDASGNVWTISPGCVSGATVCTPNGMVLTNMVGAASPTITPVGAQYVNTTMGTKPTS